MRCMCTFPDKHKHPKCLQCQHSKPHYGCFSCKDNDCELHNEPCTWLEDIKHEVKNCNPCPCCQTTKHLWLQKFDCSQHVVCDGCQLASPTREDEAEAVKAWNWLVSRITNDNKSLYESICNDLRGLRLPEDMSCQQMYIDGALETAEQLLERERSSK